MRYLLAMLTCGRPEYARRTLEAYEAFLHPKPDAIYVYDDGGQTPLDTFRLTHEWAAMPVTVESHPTRIGRCAAHANLWRHAAQSGHDWAWTVEDDILLLRPLNLHRVQELMLAEPHLQQVALVRCPWGLEIYHGGYIPMSPWKYARARTLSRDGHHYEWLRSTIDWTSSPALLRTRTMRNVEWPAEAGCESTLGPRLLAHDPEAVSGYWGWGEPYGAHIGLERAEGSHGY